MSKPPRISTVHRAVVALAFVACSLAFGPRPALAWGDEGHKIIALVANRFLDPAVREKIAAMIAADTDNLTAHDIASAATWADRYRDSDRNGSRQHYEQTWRWHFVNVELADANLLRRGFLGTRGLEFKLDVSGPDNRTIRPPWNRSCQNCRRDA